MIEQGRAGAASTPRAARSAFTSGMVAARGQVLRPLLALRELVGQQPRPPDRRRADSTKVLHREHDQRHQEENRFRQVGVPMSTPSRT